MSNTRRPGPKGRKYKVFFGKAKPLYEYYFTNPPPASSLLLNLSRRRRCIRYRRKGKPLTVKSRFSRDQSTYRYLATLSKPSQAKPSQANINHELSYQISSSLLYSSQTINQKIENQDNGEIKKD